MALIDCAECGAKISSNAHSCPHCGNPRANTEFSSGIKSTDTKYVVTYKAPVFGALLGLVGLLFVFLFWPIGIALLILGPIVGGFEKRAIPGREGACPDCGVKITVPASLEAASCIHCRKSFFVKEDKFYSATTVENNDVVRGQHDGPPPAAGVELPPFTG